MSVNLTNFHPSRKPVRLLLPVARRRGSSSRPSARRGASVFVNLISISVCQLSKLYPEQETRAPSPSRARLARISTLTRSPSTTVGLCHETSHDGTSCFPTASRRRWHTLKGFQDFFFDQVPLPTVGRCLGPLGGPGGWACSYERGTPVAP